MTKDEFLRRFYSVDTRAGDKLKYICTKAECSPKYTKSIDFSDAYLRVDTAFKGLIRLCLWHKTPEGTKYWMGIYDMLLSSNL